MRCPTIAELPPPPPGKTGWPWTEESEQLPDEMLPSLGGTAGADDRPPTTDDTPSSIVHRPSSRAWPRISIVTPSYNQGQFIEETIRSVLLQGYPNLEYMVIDGGSDDGSVEIIKKYEPWLAYWVSERDRGQANAINKGFKKTTGEIMAWLNSDDTYLPKTLHHVATTLIEASQTGLIFGSAMFTNSNGKEIKIYRGIDKSFFQKLQYWQGWSVPQPTLFFRRRLFDQVGELDESLHLALDYDWVLRASKVGCTYCTPEILSTYRLHSEAKTGKWEETKHLTYQECARILRKQAPQGSLLYWRLQMARITLPVRRAFGRVKSILCNIFLNFLVCKM